MEQTAGLETNDAEYREWLGRGELRMQRCADCGYIRHPARWLCPQCLSERWAWAPLAGRGVVETFVWYMEPFDPRFPDVPYNVAIVQLEEGPRVVTNVLDVRPGELRVGQPVTSTITTRTGGKPLLKFRPAGRGE
jgi:uncharacterized OB-fold protein